MRLNPAFQVLSEKNNQKNIEFSVSSHRDQRGSCYLLIDLPFDSISLKIGGQNCHFDTQRRAHLTVYEQYDEKQKVLSPFHITWYGFRELPSIREQGGGKQKVDDASELIDENDNSRQTTYRGSNQQSVKVHIYLDSVGQILTYTVKDNNTNLGVTGISDLEAVQLRRFAWDTVASVLINVLNLVQTNYLEKESQINKLFDELENISKNLKTQYQKYMKIATRCIKTIELKDKLSFGRPDPRAALLSKIFSIIEAQFKADSKATLKKGPQLYQPMSTEDTLDDEPYDNENRSAQKTIAPDQFEQQQRMLLEKLNDLDQEIVQFAKENSHIAIDILFYEKERLAKQLELIALSPNIVSIDRQLTIFQRNKRNLVKLIELFEEQAKVGNIENVKKLAPFVSRIDPYFFGELIKSGNSEICEFLMQNFKDCFFYMNYMVASSSIESYQTYAISFLRLAYILHKDFNLMKVLLENGADPNFRGGSVVNNMNLLSLVIYDNKIEIVELLLNHGANPNSKCEKEDVVVEWDYKKLRKVKFKAQKGKANYTTENNEETPLHIAIDKSKDPNMVELLLRYGASHATKNGSGFDAIGYAACDRNAMPNIAIVKKLVEYGADINAKQGNSTQGWMTALIFACQRSEDLTTVKDLVALGADPNRSEPCKLTTKEGGKAYIPINSFKKAVMKGHVNIVAYFFEQSDCPLTFATIADTCAWYFSKLIDYMHLIVFENKIEIAIVKDRNISNMEQLLNAAMEDILQGSFDRKIINEVIEGANSVGQQYFDQAISKNKKEAIGSSVYYTFAIEAYFIPLLFGDTEQRIAACYHIGNCYYRDNQPKMAEMFYQACVNCQSDSQYLKPAEFMLAQLKSSALSIRPTIATLKG